MDNHRLFTGHYRHNRELEPERQVLSEQEKKTAIDIVWRIEDALQKYKEYYLTNVPVDADEIPKVYGSYAFMLDGLKNLKNVLAKYPGKAKVPIKDVRTPIVYIGTWLDNRCNSPLKRMERQRPVVFGMELYQGGFRKQKRRKSTSRRSKTQMSKSRSKKRVLRKAYETRPSS